MVPEPISTVRARRLREQSAELQEPASNRFARNFDATLGQQILDITKRKREPGVEPDRMLDDLGRKTMSFERYRGHTKTVPVPPRAGYRLNVSMPHMLLRSAFSCEFWRPRQSGR